MLAVVSYILYKHYILDHKVEKHLVWLFSTELPFVLSVIFVLWPGEIFMSRSSPFDLQWQYISTGTIHIIASPWIFVGPYPPTLCWMRTDAHSAEGNSRVFRCRLQHIAGYLPPGWSRVQRYGHMVVSKGFLNLLGRRLGPPRSRHPWRCYRWIIWYLCTFPRSPGDWLG